MLNEPLSPSPDDSGLSREAYTLLAQANLLRMRGCWEEAIQNCMTALRLAPNSSSAQSLLGDIYENQGRFDDAIQWYRMALDANPDSPADQIKLDRLLQRHLPPLSSRPSESDNAVEKSVVSYLYWKAWRDSPEIALRYTSLAAAVLVIAVVFFAYTAVHHQAALSSLGLASQEVETRPVVVPSPANPSANLTAAVTWRDSSEQALLETLQSSADLTAQGITLDDIQTDPRTQQVTVTFALTATAVSRVAVLRYSLHTMEAVAALSPSASAFTMRCLLLPKTGATTSSGILLFVGDAARSVLPNTGASEPSDEQVLALFSDVWWSPQITG